MNALLRFHEARQRDARIIGLDNQWLPQPFLDICRHPMPRDRAEVLSLTKEQIAKLRLANARGTG